jgi:SAM-dependent MidA family methyltransferase
VTGQSQRKTHRLSGLLTDLAAEHPSGTLRVDTFMATALYDPEGGYYTLAEAVGGQRRDFSTIPSLSPLLGRAVARWVLSLPHSGRGPLDIIEVGAGGGHLAGTILKAAGWWARRRIRYRIVEISPRLRQAQRDHLDGSRVTWHASVAEALAETKTEATRPVVISNELVDAFPCRCLRFEKGTWRELRLPWPPSTNDPLSSHPLQDLDTNCFSALRQENWDGGVIPPGQVIEVHASYRDWLGGWASAARGLHHLTIDYGDVMPELYKDRPTGTLRGYHAHQRLTGGAVWRAPGKVDLTCDVNFSDLETWGGEWGWQTMEMTDQAGFLSRWLPATETAKPSAELVAISDPDGAGGAFKVLWQTG